MQNGQVHFFSAMNIASDNCQPPIGVYTEAIKIHDNNLSI